MKLNRNELLVVTKGKSILQEGTKAIIREAGDGHYLILAVVKGNRRISAEPMSLWLKAENFSIV